MLCIALKGIPGDGDVVDLAVYFTIVFFSSRGKQLFHVSIFMVN